MNHRTSEQELPVNGQEASVRAVTSCPYCRGIGVVADYGAFGMDFEGPKECRECNGTGLVRRRDSRGRWVTDESTRATEAR